MRDLAGAGIALGLSDAAGTPGARSLAAHPAPRRRVPGAANADRRAARGRGGHVDGAGLRGRARRFRPPVAVGAAIAPLGPIRRAWRSHARRTRPRGGGRRAGQSAVSSRPGAGWRRGLGRRERPCVEAVGGGGHGGRRFPLEGGMVAQLCRCGHVRGGQTKFYPLPPPGDGRVVEQADCPRHLTFGSAGRPPSRTTRGTTYPVLRARPGEPRTVLLRSLRPLR